MIGTSRNHWLNMLQRLIEKRYIIFSAFEKPLKIFKETIQGREQRFCFIWLFFKFLETLEKEAWGEASNFLDVLESNHIGAWEFLANRRSFTEVLEAPLTFFFFFLKKIYIFIPYVIQAGSSLLKIFEMYHYSFLGKFAVYPYFNLEIVHILCFDLMQLGF